MQHMQPQSNGAYNATRSQFFSALPEGIFELKHLTVNNGHIVKDEKYYARIESLVKNTLEGQRQWLGRFMGQGGGWDKIWDQCGYPNDSAVSAQFYRNLYDTNSIANRIVELWPKECWMTQPTIFEDESAKNVTDFEEAWDLLGGSLNPQGKSYYQDEEGSVIWNYLERADVLSGIGQFGVLLLGIDDGRNLQDPVDGIEVVINRRTGRIVTNRKEDGYRDGMRIRIYERMADSPANNEELQKIDDDLANGRVQHGYRSDAEFLENYKRPNIDSEVQYVSNGRVHNAYYSGGAPPDGAFIQGTDTQFSWMGGMGMAMPAGASLSGTDQQYFGVQFGPSERFGNKPSKSKRKLLFMRPFDESLVQVVRYEWNIRNPRFGLPVMYRITLNDPRQPHSGVGLPLATVYVHWSRLLHFADNLVVSEIFGMPRMKPLIPEIFDTRKIAAASPEGYWKACFTGISIETLPNVEADVIANKRELSEMMFDYFQGLDRALYLNQMSAKTIAPTVTDPTAHHTLQLERICIKLACPVRVFKGSERGELASSQDDEKWNERLKGRMLQYLTPQMIIPFVDRLIQIGVLPEPEGYSVKWPDLDALGDKDKAQIFLQKTQAIAAYVQGGVEAVIPPLEFLTKIGDMEEDVANEILKAASKANESGGDNMTMPQMGELGHPATAKPKPLPPIIGGKLGQQPGQGEPPIGGGGSSDDSEPNPAQGQTTPNEGLVTHGYNPIKALQRVGKQLANRKQKPLPMPGYGQIFIKESGSGQAWYVGGDGDDDGFGDVMKEALMSVQGIDDITYEAEAFPPKDEGWIQVYPKQREW